ncbi:MAG: hypothetical protein HOP32_11640 [Nitrospira sp.]|nr:hypothetical protein [Nitrospira sp.]
MKMQFVYRLAVMTALTLAFASAALADYTITVTIGDTTLPPVTNGPVIIPAGTYLHAATNGSVTIAASSAGATPQVEFPSLKSDGVEDSIKLVNTRITANTSVNNFPISFQGQMMPNPITPPTKYYKLKMAGVFQQGTGSSILVGMYMKNPTSEGFTFLQQQQHTPGAIAFSYSPPGTGWPPSGHSALGGTRIIRVDTAIKLANGKYLDFNTTNGRFIEMYSSGTPDKGTSCDPSDTTCQEEDVPGLYLSSLLEWNDGLGRQNWFCRVTGLFCSDWP